MGRREVNSGRLLFLLIVSLRLVTCQHSDDEATTAAPPCPPPLALSSPNSCPNYDLLTQLLDTITCTPAEPPPHDDYEELSTAVTMTEAVVLALLTSKKEEGTRWEILMFMMVLFPSAVWALFVFEFPLRPPFEELLEQSMLVLFVNGVMAFFLPVGWMLVPALCFTLSVHALIIARHLP